MIKSLFAWMSSKLPWQQERDIQEDVMNDQPLKLELSKNGNDSSLLLAPIVDEIQNLPETIRNGYDAQLIMVRLLQLREARLSKDADQLIFLIRSTLSRDLGCMSSSETCHISSVQKLNQAYIWEVIASLDCLHKVHLENDYLNAEATLQTIERASNCFGNTALLLSGGACNALSHIGVLKVLFQEKLDPQVVCGSSAGSIIAGVYCIYDQEGLQDVLDDYLNWKLYPFSGYNQRETVFVRIARFLKHGVFLDAKYLVESLKEIFGDITFSEAYRRSKRILNVTVSLNGAYDMPNLLNYITAPNVLIWSAVAASCSLPLFFKTIQIWAKNPLSNENYPWNPTFPFSMDGSVEGDIPKARLAELFNVNYFIISQVNPHVSPIYQILSKKNEQKQTAKFDFLQSMCKKFFSELSFLVYAEINHSFQIIQEIGFANTFVEKLRQFLNQSYTGDVLILPKVDVYSMKHFLKNPTTEYLQETTRRGEEATIPKLLVIRNNTAIEIALKRTIREFRSLIFSRRINPNVYLSNHSSRSHDNLISQSLKVPVYAPKRGRSPTLRNELSLVKRRSSTGLSRKRSSPQI